jgi:3-hydroxybutyryl-CoA dehydratase
MIFKTGDRFVETFLVSTKTYSDFIQLFKDNNPLHTNEQFAISKGFKGMVMHGNILNGFLSYFIGERLPDKNVIIHSQEIQFKNPVYLNDELKFTAIISGIYESVNAIEFKYDFKNADSKTVAKGKILIGLLT